MQHGTVCVNALGVHESTVGYMYSKRYIAMHVLQMECMCKDMHGANVWNIACRCSLPGVRLSISRHP